MKSAPALVMTALLAPGAASARAGDGPAPRPAGVDREPTLWGELVNPDRDCKTALDREGRRATITVPGTPHLLSAEIGRMNAPRLLRDVRGDFAARVRVRGTGRPSGAPTAAEYYPFHGAGLLLWQDPGNYVRLEIATELRGGRPFSYANFEMRRDGELAMTRGVQDRRRLDPPPRGAARGRDPGGLRPRRQMMDPAPAAGRRAGRAPAHRRLRRQLGDRAIDGRVRGLSRRGPLEPRIRRNPRRTSSGGGRRHD